jgi:FdhD protein
MKGSCPANVTRFTPGGTNPDIRILPIEAPVSIEFNGIGYAVMMATPNELEDFALGFALSERIVEKRSDLEEVLVQPIERGWLVKIQIAAHCVGPMIERVRVRVSESSCGLCGLENLEQVMRPLPCLAASPELPPVPIFQALAELPGHQPLNAETGGVHAAAFCSMEGNIQFAREDVGRHTALDKLIGAMSKQGIEPTSGFMLLSSRCSYELVEKAVTAGCPTLVTVSTATSLAVSRASEAGLRLIALARPDSALRFN